MSFYNLLFGENPLSDYLLGILDLTKEKIPRYRDCFLTEDNKICIYTRTGGGNRDYYDNLKRHKANCDYEKCDHIMPFNDDLRQHKWFTCDRDDDFDCTYAYFYYDPPQDIKELFECFSDSEAKSNPGKKWECLLEKIKNKENDQEIQEVVNKMKPLMDKIIGKEIELP